MAWGYHDPWESPKSNQCGECKETATIYRHSDKKYFCVDCYNAFGVLPEKQEETKRTPQALRYYIELAKQLKDEIEELRNEKAKLIQLSDDMLEENLALRKTVFLQEDDIAKLNKQLIELQEYKKYAKYAPVESKADDDDQKRIDARFLNLEV